MRKIKIIHENKFHETIDILNDIFETNLNSELYLVGGSVRDLILGIEPKDYDFVTNLSPDSIIQLINDNKNISDKYNITINQDDSKFGVIRVKFKNDNDIFEYEIVTFRGDGEYTDNRRPDSIYFSDIETDSNRRDFTINALYMNLNTLEIVDFHNGYNDLKNGVLKTVGVPEKRFEEDSLRILRAVRFAVKYNLKMETELFEIVTDTFLNDSDFLKNISRERQLNEFEKIVKYIDEYSGDLKISLFLLVYFGQYKNNLKLFVPHIVLNNMVLNAVLNLMNLEQNDVKEILTYLRFKKSDIELVYLLQNLNNGIFDLKTYKILQNKNISEIKDMLSIISKYSLNNNYNTINKLLDFEYTNNAEKFLNEGNKKSDMNKLLLNDFEKQKNNFINNL